jgi:hypothetical protein
LLIALNPSNETETPESLPEARSHASSSFLTSRSNSPPMPFGAKSVTSTKDRPSSTCHQSTQFDGVKAQRDARRLPAGEPGRQKRHEGRADDRAIEPAAPADRDPDRQVDRRDGRDFRRIDDAGLRIVERARRLPRSPRSA